jgi:hypothetical protein
MFHYQIQSPAVKPIRDADGRQDGTTFDADDFWQLIMSAGYLMEGENRGYEREKMKWVAERLNAWFAAHPEIREDGSLECFAMCSVHRLISAFVFNDSIGADQPDFKEGLLEQVLDHVGGTPFDDNNQDDERTLERMMDGAAFANNSDEPGF